MDDNILDKIFSAASGVWALVCMAAVALFKAWPNIMERIDERQRDREAEKSGDWSRLRAERDRLQALLHECERERAELMMRAVTAEAALQGYGIARQQMAVEDAVQRLTDAEAKKNPDG